MWSKGINRNIVECKDRNGTSGRRRSEVLIETLWNVKGIKVFSIFLTISVLIETLWNVKQVVLLAVILICSVLIETLWNVKQISQSTVRVIVAVLIETLWNVKRKTSPFRHRMILY